MSRQSDRFNLKDTFPVSLAFILRRNIRTLSFLAVLSMIFLFLFTFVGSIDQGNLGNVRQFLNLKKLLIGGVVVALLVLRLIYDYLYLLRYDYYIERGRLHIESGVIIRQEASVPLTPLCEFYLEKRWIDLLLGTKDLVMKAAIGEDQEICRIQALKESNAKALKRFLIEQSEKGGITAPVRTKEERDYAIRP